MFEPTRIANHVRFKIWERDPSFWDTCLWPVEFHATIHHDFSTRKDVGSDWTPWMMILQCVAMPLYMLKELLVAYFYAISLTRSICRNEDSYWSCPLRSRKRFCLWVFMVDIEKNHWWRWFRPKKPGGVFFQMRPESQDVWVWNPFGGDNFFGGVATLECPCLFHPGWFWCPFQIRTIETSARFVARNAIDSWQTFV